MSSGSCTIIARGLRTYKSNMNNLGPLSINNNTLQTSQILVIRVSIVIHFIHLCLPTDNVLLAFIDWHHYSVTHDDTKWITNAHCKWLYHKWLQFP